MNAILEGASYDSVASVIFPRNIYQRRTAPLRGAECNREVTPVSFFLCLISSTGIGVTAAMLWGLAVKIPYAPITRAYLTIVSDVLNFGAGLLSIPCFWITYTLHGSNTSKAFLPLVIALFGLCIVILLVSEGINYAYKFEPESQTLNRTLLQSMPLYTRNMQVFKTWNMIHKHLSCCGSTSYKEWVGLLKTIPKSCCLQNSCDDGKMYTQGCAHKIALDMMRSRSLSLGLTGILTLVHVRATALSGYGYLQQFSRSLACASRS
ncbi:tetraspanin-9-like isoform X2 [Photinus pyralis]|uniref:tetraspanin-9-like isoform X2 n=1 Tax=Photinus pyralis TaxID=7054 RepID=UPI0012677B4D|nr:tetraspanin-9-like isoform X2 [Photinus pyralis]